MKSIGVILALVVTIFGTVSITYVGLKQLDRAIRSQPTCFPPYFLMKGVTDGNIDGGVRSHGSNIEPKSCETRVRDAD